MTSIAFLLRDVPDRAEHPHAPAVILLVEIGINVHPMHSAVQPDHAVLGMEGCILGNHAAQPLFEPGEVIGVDPVRPVPILSGCGTGGVTKDDIATHRPP